MADIFDEVSEDLRKDQYKQIWSKYKKFIISFICIFVFSIITFKYIEYYQEKKNIEIATLYFDGLEEINNKNFEKAETIFNKILENDHFGYAVLASFKLATLYIVVRNPFISNI